MNRRRRGPAPALAVLAAVPVCLAAGCRGPSFEPYAETPGPYDRFTPLQLEALVEADERARRGEIEVARRYLSSLAAATPDNLVVATRLQEIELELLGMGLTVPGVYLGQEGRSPTERLQAVYLTRTRTQDTAAAYVLAARLAPDPTAALALLGEALDRDPECVWAHYAIAWVHAGAKRYPEARDALGAALALDPGHFASRRLEAALLARSGESERAATAHRAWLERFSDDARVPPRRVAEARLDLASLHVLLEEPEDALEVLQDVDPRELADPIGRALVRATALEMLGRVDEALVEARAAAANAPTDARPRLHEALLLGERLGDDQGARAAWESVLRSLDEEIEPPTTAWDASDRGMGARQLADLLLRLQARAALARLPAAVSDEPGP